MRSNMHIVWILLLTDAVVAAIVVNALVRTVL